MPRVPALPPLKAGRVASVVGFLVLVSAAAVFFFHGHGWLLYYGDAEAHLNIARRIVDSRTPGYDQLGSPWLPLPHCLMLPLVRLDAWWRSGLAGAAPSAACFVAAGLFLWGAMRRAFACEAVAATAVALFALNPNVLYLQSIPMSEPAELVSLLALLYFTVRFGQTQGLLSAAGAGVAVCAATLSRYEGWFLIPFVGVYFLLAATHRRYLAAFVFAALAALGPLYWLGHNWWLAGDALEFLRGPYSARAIQGDAPYPGKGDWGASWFYYRTAAQVCAGTGLAILAIPGAAAALFKRAFWPLILLALPGVFYVWSMHSSGTPIFVPSLWPHGYYNSRYGLAVLPLLAVAAAGLVAAVPARLRVAVAALVVALATVPWLLHPQPRNWITWEESRVNSEARRQWTGEAAAYLAPRYVPGSGIITSFGDITGIFRQAGIPLRETFTGDNGLPWLAAVRRPELYLTQQWAVAMAGDAVDKAVEPPRSGYRLEKTIVVKGAPEIRIYRRTGGTHGTA